MLGRNSTMNRKCSKEAGLLHTIAQQAPSIPTTELCIGVYDTHGDYNFCWHDTSLPFWIHRAEKRQRIRVSPCLVKALAHLQYKCRYKIIESRFFFAWFRAIKWELPLSTWLFLSCKLGPDAKEDLSTYNSVGSSLLRITFLPLPATLCLDMPRTAVTWAA